MDGPIREYYLVGRLDTADENAWRTEIGWPIFSTGAAALLACRQDLDILLRKVHDFA